MYNTEKQTVTVISFTTGVDAYGQTRQTEAARRTVEMYLKSYNQTQVSDVRLIDATLVGLTDDKNITSGMQILANDQLYNVLYIIKSSRKTVVYMKEAA